MGNKSKKQLVVEDKDLPPEKRRDYQLLKRYAKGDEEAFIEIYETYSRKLLEYVYRCVGDWHEAEDIVQEVFVQVMKDASTFEPRASLSTWIYRIATFMCLKRQRDKAVRKRIVERETAAGTFDKPAPESEGEKSAMTAEQVETLHNIVEELPMPQRVAFVLREYESRSYDEIASMTDAEIGTVKTRLFRARQTVREAMKREGFLQE